ncbi:hypothetical protein NIM87_05920 [Devosia sp. XJ19-1]|uniref:Uncharacterized protein n=1 Tax=Devosia ureilytica TaxID=2952754 RepID=A0A9Q4AM25_9HYPH|nr:hypothetical protein [Devosia ureilytica]MCP8883029.1 hypothetical protein [Devosia ureilytica]MCP8886603.1 hypothetical protein [Devosia ureilytica]
MRDTLAPMARAPSIDPKRDNEIARLRKLLVELDRIPAHRRAEECADEREATIKAMLRDLDPPIYQWTTRDDEIAEDAITVGIGGTSVEMLVAGLTYVEPTASIYWCARVAANGVYEAGSEMGPWPVREALARAEVLRNQMGYNRVVVTMAELGLWRPEYGKLALKEGF